MAGHNVFLFGAALVLLAGVGSAQAEMHGDVIQDADGAIRIGRAILETIHPGDLDEAPIADVPLAATRRDGTWYVTLRRPPCPLSKAQQKAMNSFCIEGVGQSFVIRLAAHDAQVLDIKFYK